MDDEAEDDGDDEERAEQRADAKDADAEIGEEEDDDHELEEELDDTSEDEGEGEEPDSDDDNEGSRKKKRKKAEPEPKDRGLQLFESRQEEEVDSLLQSFICPPDGHRMRAFFEKSFFDKVSSLAPLCSVRPAVALSHLNAAMPLFWQMWTEACDAEFKGVRDPVHYLRAEIDKPTTDPLRRQLMQKWEAQYAQVTQLRRRIDESEGEFAELACWKSPSDAEKKARSKPPYTGERIRPSLMQCRQLHLLQSEKTVANWSKPGVGKTASAVLASLKLRPTCTLILGPNNVVDEGGAWQSEIISMLGRFSGKVKPSLDDPRWATARHRFVLLNYDKLGHGVPPRVRERLEKCRLPEERQACLGPFCAQRAQALADKLPIDLIVLDEVQNVKNESATRTVQLQKLIEAARERNPELRVLALSATPFANDPKEAWDVLKLLDAQRFRRAGPSIDGGTAETVSLASRPSPPVPALSPVCLCSRRSCCTRTSR